MVTKVTAGRQPRSSGEKKNGDGEDRIRDLTHAKRALYQLSYVPDEGGGGGTTTNRLVQS